MLKRDEINDPQSCLNKAADDEPIFVLRAQDALAPEIIEIWAMRAEAAGTPRAKVEEAYALADAMQLWPRRKNPD